MRETANWLIDTGKPMWSIDDINAVKMNNRPEEYIVLKVNGIGVAVMTLNFYDPFFWPDIENGNQDLFISFR